MPFTKQGTNDYTGPSGRHFNSAQVKRYYAQGGHFAKGGPVLGRTESWMKSPDRFRTSGRAVWPKIEETEDQYPKKSNSFGK